MRTTDAHRIEDVIDFVAAATEAIKSEQADVAGKMARGDAKTYDEYQRMVGQIKGMERAIDVLAEQRKIFLKGDDDDE